MANCASYPSLKMMNHLRLEKQRCALDHLGGRGFLKVKMSGVPKEELGKISQKVLHIENDLHKIDLAVRCVVINL